jgi:hypothetical protein
MALLLGEAGGAPARLGDGASGGDEARPLGSLPSEPVEHADERVERDGDG